MERLSFKSRKAMIAYGEAMQAIDLTTSALNRIEGLKVVSVSHGVYGMNGALLVDAKGQYYIIKKRSSSLFYYV